MFQITSLSLNATYMFALALANAPYLFAYPMDDAGGDDAGMAVPADDDADDTDDEELEELEEAEEEEEEEEELVEE